MFIKYMVLQYVNAVSCFHILLDISQSSGNPFFILLEWTLQVKVQDGVPAVITPVKPKYYFTSVTTIAAKSAIKLQ